METPRPTLDVINLDCSEQLYYKRANRLKRRLGVRRKARRILKTFRTMQQDKLPGESIEDPYPYDPSYIFYVELRIGRTARMESEDAPLSEEEAFRQLT